MSRTINTKPIRTVTVRGGASLLVAGETGEAEYEIRGAAERRICTASGCEVSSESAEETSEVFGWRLIWGWATVAGEKVRTRKAYPQSVCRGCRRSQLADKYRELQANKRKPARAEAEIRTADRRRATAEKQLIAAVVAGE